MCYSIAIMWAGARRWLTGLSGLSAAVIVGCLAFGHACNGPGPNTPNGVKPVRPTLRLYLLSTIAGSLEPCGCTAGQLGGLDHLAALLSAQRETAPQSLFLAVGPLFFLNPALTPDTTVQDRYKAETIAQSLNDMQLAAWTPGANDWADSSVGLRKYLQLSGTRLLAAGLKDPELTKTDRLVSGSEIYEVGSLNVGIVGLSDPKNRAGAYPESVSLAPDEQRLEVIRTEVAKLKRQGAQLLVALAALDRGTALRIAEGIGELNFLAVGKPYAAGDLDDSQQPPTLVGNTLVVETANHGQTVAIVDIYTEAQPRGGLLKLEDGGGIARAQRINALSRRIRKLEVRINNWQKGGSVNAEDLAARRADLQRLRQQRTGLASQSTPSNSGDYYHYRVQEVREQLGSEPRVSKRFTAFYQRVNQHNKQAFADRKPPPAAAGQASYVGAQSCLSCHAQQYAFWNKRPHAKAYQTLQKGYQEYNLDCVGCHVTGYGKPGGSTVTHNEHLKNVQCEQCHGPGSLHLAQPTKKDLVILKRDPRWCVDECHHPPHVSDFDPVAKMAVIIGPGHQVTTTP